MTDGAQPPQYLRRNQVQIIRIIGRLRDPVGYSPSHACYSYMNFIIPRLL